MNTRHAGLVAAALAGLLASGSAIAKDERLRFPVKDALASPAATGKLNEVKLYWGDQRHPAVATELGTFTANKKTNAFNKSNQEACEWAFLSAVVSLQERAVKEGGNAVVGIHSVYRNSNFSSATEFECGTGAVVAGVALRGKVVKLK